MELTPSSSIKSWRALFYEVTSIKEVSMMSQQSPEGAFLTLFTVKNLSTLA